jgi:hypothetical protein
LSEEGEDEGKEKKPGLSIREVGFFALKVPKRFLIW